MNNEPSPSTDERAAFDQNGAPVANWDAPAETIEAPSKPRTKLRILIGGTAVTAAAATAFFLLPKDESQTNNPPQATQPVATGEAFPSPSSTESISTPPVSSNPEAISSTLKTLEIEANQSDKEMAQDVIHTLSSWRMAGATHENSELFYTKYGDLTIEAYATKIANEQTAMYAPVLFGDNYATNPQLKNDVDGITKGNVKNITAFLQTADKSVNPVNKEPYTRSIIFDELTSATVNGSEKSLTINYHEADNSDKNIFGAGHKSTVNGNKGVAIVSLKTTGSKMIITAFTLADK